MVTAGNRKAKVLESLSSGRNIIAGETLNRADELSVEEIRHDAAAVLLSAVPLGAVSSVVLSSGRALFPFTVINAG